MASTLPNINYGKHCMNLVLDIKKMSGQRKALIERLDIVNQRINYLRTIKKKKKERFKTVYLDETWCDTNHTTSHQWAAEDD